MRNVAKRYNPSEENASIIVSINKYGRVLSNWEYLKEIEKLEARIDKAIEYIDRRDIDWGSEEHDKLLDILKGSDKE